MKKFLCLLMVLGLAGCKPELKGTLSIRSNLPVMVKGQMIQIPPGNYRAEYTAGDNAQFAVLKVENVNGQTLKIQLNFPAGQSAPQYYGDLNLAAQVSGQPFDIVGKIDTEHDQSETMYGSQSCTYYLNEYTCHKQKDGQHVCGYESVPHYGTQPTQYYYSSSSTSATSSFRRPGTNYEIATFGGYESDSTKHETPIGPCL